jgi:hypothetical protein
MHCCGVGNEKLRFKELAELCLRISVSPHYLYKWTMPSMSDPGEGPNTKN